MKTIIILIFAVFSIWIFGGLKVNGQSVSNDELAKSPKLSTTGVTTETAKLEPIGSYSRKATIQICIDGKPYRRGEILTVKSGQQLLIGFEMVGGRKDYCKFPDTDFDLTGISEILSRGENGITYRINGVKAEWKLIKEEPLFDVDKYLQINTIPTKPTAEITVTNDKFSQTFLKISIKSSWLFTRNGETTQEENNAEETINFKLEGESDIWFLTRNIQATGIKNEQVMEKLKDIQSAYDTIETNFHQLNFTALQQSNRKLQNVVSSLKSVLDEVNTSNPSYHSEIFFIGLPSDNPYNDLRELLIIQRNWEILETLLNEQKQMLVNLPIQPNNKSNEEFLKIIANYVDWQQKLPENTFNILSQYISELDTEKILVSKNINSIFNAKMTTNYSQAIVDFSAFLDQRIQNIQDEIQKINSTQTRLQKVRLFDGMFRSYFSSIYWAEWKDAREFDNQTISLKNEL